MKNIIYHCPTLLLIILLPTDFLIAFTLLQLSAAS